MTRGRWLGAAALVASLGAGAYFGSGTLAASAPTAAAPKPAPAPEPTASVVETVGTESHAGETPMAQRVAIIGFLNKRNGEARELVMKPGQAYRVGEAIVRLRACEQTAPWEQDQLTGAFLQLDVQGTDKRWRRAFSGWMFKDRPALNVVQHPVYDVWPKRCTMSFPGGPAIAPAASAPARRASNASNAPSTTAAPDSSPATESPSAEPSNAL